MVTRTLPRIVIPHLIRRMREINPHTHRISSVAVTRIRVACGEALLDAETGADPLRERPANRVADGVGCELRDGAAGLRGAGYGLRDLLVEAILHGGAVAVYAGGYCAGFIGRWGW